jgi:thymidylate synthase (FAD)
MTKPSMTVQVLARTIPNYDVLDATPYTDQCDGSGPETLAEFAGRMCYKSWSRPNPATATNEGYLGNILGQGHYSVLEHASVTFYVQHVSRALLLELERHRHLSFSVESQRYVDQRPSHPSPVIPPALEGTSAETVLTMEYDVALRRYEETYETLREVYGLTKKEAREAARAFLPNATPVDFVVTGNLRAWRDVLAKRFHVAADAEIREFADEVLRLLRQEAPHAYQVFPTEPFGA